MNKNASALGSALFQVLKLSWQMQRLWHFEPMVMLQ
jgi:hypothetical protein